MRARKKDTTTYPVPFFITSTADHITGKTGLTPTVTILKTGSTAFGAASGAVTEVGNGWYLLAGSSSDRNTLGASVYHVAPSSCDPAEFQIDVLSIDPFDVNFGMGATVTVTATTPLVADGSIANVVPGDDYFAVDGRSWDFTYTGAPSLTGSTPTLSIRLRRAGTNVVTISGTVLSATSLRFQPTSTQTLLLADNSTYDYDVQALLTGTAHVTTLETGTLTTTLNLSTP